MKHRVTYKYTKTHKGFDGQCVDCPFAFHVPARGSLEAAADAAQKMADNHTQTGR